MERELVTGSTLFTAGGGESRQSRTYRYSETLEEFCSYYMSIGMSYHDYWEEDCALVKYYRKVDERKRERENFNAWLQGAYVYEALLKASPVLNAMIKRKTPYPYRSSPIPLTETIKNKRKDEENRKKMENGLNVFRGMMVAVNKKFRKGG